MQRRRVLQAIGTSTAAGFAGCLGLGGDGNGDGEPTANDSNGTENGGQSQDDGNGGQSQDDGNETAGGTGNGNDAIEVDGSWPTFQGDATSTGTGQGSATGPAAEPSVEWTVTAEDELWGDPVIVDGTVIAGSWDGQLYAVSLSTGELQWTHRTGDAISYPAAVVSGTVFAGSHREVAALDVGSGDPYWTSTIEHTISGGLAVADGLVCVPTHDNLLALSAATGEQQWTVRTGGPIQSVPHVTDDTAYFTSSDGNIYASDLEGELRWQQRISSSGGFPSPTVVDGTVYFGWGDGTMYALDASDGSELWTDKAGGSEVVAVADGTVYVAGYPLNAIDAETQEVLWTAEEPEGGFTDFTVGTDRVYLGTDEARVFAYDRETGAEQWSHQGNYEVTTSVAIADESLVYGDEFGNIVTLR